LTFCLATSRFIRNFRFKVNSFDFTSLFLYAVFKEHGIDARSPRHDVRIDFSLTAKTGRYLTSTSLKNIGSVVKHFCFNFNPV